MQFLGAVVVVAVTAVVAMTGGGTIQNSTDNPRIDASKRFNSATLAFVRVAIDYQSTRVEFRQTRDPVS